jgi:acyl-CoA oxidase
LIQTHLVASSPPQPVVQLSAWDCLNNDEHIPSNFKTLRKELRQMLEKEIKPDIIECYEKAILPESILTKLSKIDIINKYLAHYPWLICEVARIDLSIATMLMVQLLSINTIQLTGSQDQIDTYIPKLKDIKILCGWGLTEETIGSDASSITTTSQKVEEGYIIKGNKKWIGNANRDYIIVWTRNVDTKKIEGFIVDIKAKGVSVSIMKHKGAVRIVQNCHLTFNDVIVPEKNKLAKADGFSSIEKILLRSRLVVTWEVIGAAVGVYDACIRYVDQREQFGTKLTAFQLIQDKLVRMMGNIQAMIALCVRATKLYEQNLGTIGMMALNKGFCTKLAREVARLGREAMGGNGIIMDNYAMKALVDIEAVYTYEGTYDVQTLICGRELTGISAFKPM